MKQCLFVCARSGRLVWAIAAMICASVVVGPVSAQSLLGSEGFDGGVPPTGWIQVDVGGTGNLWTARAEVPSPVSGGNAAGYGASIGDNDVWLISGAIDASAASMVYLDYWELVGYGEDAVVHDVYYSTDYSGLGDPNAATWTLVNGTIGADWVWEEKVFDISSVSGASSLYIAFRYAGNYASLWFVDDVRVWQPLPHEVVVAAVDPDSDQQRGDSTDYTFRVTNFGSGPDAFDLTGSGAYFDSLSTTATAMIETGSTEYVTVTATVPCSAINGTPEPLELTATSQGDGSVSHNASLEVTAIELDAGGGSAAEGDYYFANSISACAASTPAFGWIDISTTGTEVTGSLNDDNFIGPFPIGFSFPFFGASYTELYISSNGWISFDGTEPSAEDNRTNTALPSAAVPNNLIAVFWDDMNPDDADPGDTHVYYGAGPGGEMVVSFERLPEYDSNPSPDAWITSQVVLYPNGNIRVQNLEHGSALTLTSSSVGIENDDGTLGVEYHFNGAGGVLFSSPLAVEFGQVEDDLPVELMTFRIE